MDRKDIINQILEDDKRVRGQPEQIETATSDTYLTSFKGLVEAIRKEVAQVEQSQGERPKKPLEVAQFLRNFIRFIRIKPASRNQEPPLYFYHPDKGVYLEDDELLKDLIQLVAPHTTKKQALDVLYIISHQSPLKAVDNDYTALGNMLYRAKTGTFEVFSPSVIVTRKINTAYNNQARQPKIGQWTPESWLLELFDSDIELYSLALQMLRACVTGQSLKKLFWLYGEGGTGKGTLQQLIINLVGLENVATLKITELNKSRFTNSILVGKSVVIGDDVQKDALIKDTSDLFSLVTGDIMTIEDKGKHSFR